MRKVSHKMEFHVVRNVNKDDPSEVTVVAGDVLLARISGPTAMLAAGALIRAFEGDNLKGLSLVAFDHLKGDLG